jgi:hypothetical protein
VVDRDNTVRMDGREIASGVLGYGRWQPVELRGGEVTQRPAKDALPTGITSQKPQSHPADLTAALVRDREAELRPAGGIVAHQQLIDRRCRHDEKVVVSRAAYLGVKSSQDPSPLPRGLLARWDELRTH